MGDDIDVDYEELLDKYDSVLKRHSNLTNILYEKKELNDQTKLTLELHIQNFIDYDNFVDDISFINEQLDIQFNEYLNVILLYEESKMLVLERLYEIYRYLHELNEEDLRRMICWVIEYINQCKEEDKFRDNSGYGDSPEIAKAKDELRILERVLRKKTI